MKGTVQGATLTGEKWRDNYQTPRYIRVRIDAFFGFKVFDPCPPDPNFNGLEIDWPEDIGIYINPPFSEYEMWVDKGLRQTNYEQVWIMNHDSSTMRMRKLLAQASAMCMLGERVQWIDPRTGNPVMVLNKKTGKWSKGTDPAKSQTLLYLGNSPQRFKEVLAPLGRVLLL